MSYGFNSMFASKGKKNSQDPKFSYCLARQVCIAVFKNTEKLGGVNEKLVMPTPAM